MIFRGNLSSSDDTKMTKKSVWCRQQEESPNWVVMCCCLVHGWKIRRLSCRYVSICLMWNFILLFRFPWDACGLSVSILLRKYCHSVLSLSLFQCYILNLPCLFIWILADILDELYWVIIYLNCIDILLKSSYLNQVHVCGSILFFLFSTFVYGREPCIYFRRIWCCSKCV